MPAVREVVAGEPLVVGRSLNNGLTFAVKHPEQVGADRITCAVAAVALLGCPVAVVDLGTATTVSVVGKRNEFLGGAILPGLTLMRDALSRGTAQLPDIALRRPRAIVGGDTVSAILSGIMYGTAGAIERLVAGMEKAHRFRVHLVLTGGHARFLSPLLARPHVTRPMLAFEGLRLIYLRNLVHIREDAIS
jgi:type III pantothenate kinase